ncbi:MAG: hypothetical protein K8I60_04435 [Anaerolineae bacterium]|nr:hypothetical protein [Anaerolineae bacterium]
MNSKNVLPVQLFISTDDAACTAVQDYLEAWVQEHNTVSLEVIPILDDPEQLVRIGINYTPALVVKGKLISHRCSVDDVKAYLESLAE